LDTFAFCYFLIRCFNYIFDIGSGVKEGNKTAAITAFEELGSVAGDAAANASTLFDGLIVIGGGLSGAYPLFLQKLVDEMNANFTSLSGQSLSRMEILAFNLEDEKGINQFIENTATNINVPLSDKTVSYDPVKKIGVGISKLGTSKAVSIGAYAVALTELDKQL